MATYRAWSRQKKRLANFRNWSFSIHHSYPLCLQLSPLLSPLAHMVGVGIDSNFTNYFPFFYLLLQIVQVTLSLTPNPIQLIWKYSSWSARKTFFAIRETLGPDSGKLLALKGRNLSILSCCCWQQRNKAIELFHPSVVPIPQKRLLRFPKNYVMLMPTTSQKNRVG